MSSLGSQGLLDASPGERSRGRDNGPGGSGKQERKSLLESQGLHHLCYVNALPVEGVKSSSAAKWGSASPRGSGQAACAPALMVRARRAAKSGGPRAGSYLQRGKHHHLLLRALDLLQQDGPLGLLVQLVDADGVVLPSGAERGAEAGGLSPAPHTSACASVPERRTTVLAGRGPPGQPARPSN